MRKRSPREIAFRLGQELHNLRFWATQPRLHARGSSGSPLPGLPDPAPVAAALRETTFAAEAIALADHVCSGRYPLFGELHDLGPEPQWRSDFVHARTSNARYFRLIPYLDFAAVGDHKVIWELNRQQYLILLAQAYRFTAKRHYLETAERLLASWLAANPFMCGINWASALEVAFRALSWLWVVHLTGSQQFLEPLYRHGLYLERNLSYYFAPNTHLLGEALALYALGVAFPEWPRARQWTALGHRVTRAQLDKQIQPDGSHFEQSSYYHVYALDMFLLFRALGGDVPDERLAAMAGYLHALHGPARAIPFLGDNDGGRLFHPYGDGARFGRASLATSALLLGRTDWPYDPADLHGQAAWWFGASFLRDTAQRGTAGASEVFRNSGLVVLRSGGTQVVFDCGPFGRGSGGHSHADTLSLVVRHGAHDILIDPGTFTYVADPAERDRFRGTAAHNTVRIGGRNQATPAGPFRWENHPEVELVSFTDNSAEGICRTAHGTHRRRIELSPTELRIVDDVTGSGAIEQFWHLGPGLDPSMLCFSSGTPAIEAGHRSRRYGQKEPCTVVRVRAGEIEASLLTVIKLPHSASNQVHE